MARNSDSTQHEPWKRRVDPSTGTARWAFEPHVDADNGHGRSLDPAPMAFVSQLVVTPAHPDGRLIFTDVRDADAAVGPRGDALSDDELKAVAQFSTAPLDEKYAWLRYNTSALLGTSDAEAEDEGINHLILRVNNPESLLVDMMAQLLDVPIEHLHRPLRVESAEAEAIDTDRWFTLVLETLFDEASGVFVRPRSVDTNPVWTINPSALQASADGRVSSYRAVGRLLGRVLLEGRSFHAHLAGPLLRHLLAAPLTLADVGTLDPDAYATLLGIQTNEVDVDALSLTFCVQGPVTGDVELVENGHEIRVSDANKLEYVRLRMQYILLDAVAEPLDDLMTGLFEVVPQDLLVVFTPDELDHVLSNPPAFDDLQGDDFDLFDGTDPFDKFDPFGDDREPGVDEEP